MKAMILALACCVTCRLAADPGQPTHLSPDPSNPPWATVTIPYAELRALWEAAETQARELQQARQPLPPINAILLSSDYEFRGLANAAVLDAVYHVRTLTDDWHLVPLLGGDVRLNQADLDQNNLLWRQDHYCLLTRGKGDHHLQLRFALSTPAEWTSLRRLRLLPAPSALNRLRISGAPDGMAIRIPGLAAESETDGATTYHLPSDAPELVLTLEPNAPSLPPVPSTWTLHFEALVRFHEGRLIYRVRAHAQADDGSGLSLDLVLPANALAAQATGDDLADCRVGPPEAGRRKLHLAWNTRDLLDRTFMLSYELPQPPLSTHWLLQAPQLANSNPVRVLFVVLPVDGLALASPDLRDVRQSSRLPDWMREQVESGDYYTAETGAELTLDATWLPRVHTAQAMISQAQFQSRIVEDGGLLVTAEFTLQHEAPLNWRVRLPAVDQLLTCQVNGHPTQPVRRDPQEIELPLAVPHNQTSKVAFSYAARLPALDPVSGRLDLELPRTDLFIHQLNWLISLPDRYESTALEGNVRIAPAARASPETGADSGHLLRLTKELVQGESPRAEIHYQRRGLTDGN
ncbi:MAG: hypothetical protein KJ072_09010 [Verrucomicrobia bacterium]|nr:hypothetical protein [Verrucomicrobiota bacterium]